MDIKDRIAIVTGGGGGIGSAVARHWMALGARHVVVADRNGETARAVGEEIGCLGIELDVTDESALDALVERVETEIGPVDIFFSNAGAGGAGGLLEAPNEAWQLQWELHVMAHVYAARAVLPSMLARGEGYLISTASAAGLLAAVGSAPYSVTKAACIKLCETIAIAHGDDGIGVSVLCPQGVNTAMAPAPARRRRHRRHRRARVRRRGRHRRGARRPVPDPPPPRGADVRGAQGHRPRPLAQGHAPPAPPAAADQAG